MYFKISCCRWRRIGWAVVGYATISNPSIPSYPRFGDFLMVKNTTAEPLKTGAGTDPKGHGSGTLPTSLKKKMKTIRHFFAAKNKLNIYIDWTKYFGFFNICFTKIMFIIYNFPEPEQGLWSSKLSGRQPDSDPSRMPQKVFRVIENNILVHKGAGPRSASVWYRYLSSST